MNKLAKRKLILSALKAAKPLVAKVAYPYGDKDQFICHALKRAAREGLCAKEASELAENMVMWRVGSHFTVECWLGANVPEYSKYDHASDAVQQYRHRWLKSLIEEFSK